MSVVLDPKTEFANSAAQVRLTEHDIERLLRQTDIALRNMKQEGKVDLKACATVVGKARELRLIDETDLQDMTFKTIEETAGAFDFIKLNAKNIMDIAFHPKKYEQMLEKAPERVVGGPKRRHFCELTS